jgi:hypothetical protein
MADTGQIAKSGTWQYDGCVLHEVWIVKQNFDFYYDDGFDDAPEDLNEDGELFQVVVAKDGKVLSVGLGFHTIEKAIEGYHLGRSQNPASLRWQKVSPCRMTIVLHNRVQ